MEELHHSNPYEQQLYALFKSYDLNKNECLDKRELNSLCEALELDEGRTAALFKALTHVNKVSFSAFKEALLKILDGSSTTSDWSTEDDVSREPSPDREVSPKFVFGEKKYGRRSKPEKGVKCISEEIIEDDFKDCDGYRSSTPLSKEIGPTCVPSSKSSTSQQLDPEILTQTEIALRTAWEKLGLSTNGFMQRNQFSSLCCALGFNSLSPQEVEDLFRKLDTDRDNQISFKELLKLLRNSDLLSSEPVMAPSPDVSAQEFQNTTEFSGVDLTSPGVVSIDTLSELWETAGLSNPASLLHDLGLSHKSEVNISHVSSMLDKELANFQRCENGSTESLQVTLLMASLAISQFQIKMYRCCLDQMEHSQDKLYADLNAANERATLLAQEVDDHHARMEKATQQQIKLLEQKHAEQMKQLSLQLLNEREQLREQSSQLEAKLEKSRAEETKLKSDLSSLQNEYNQVERENQCLKASVEEKEKFISQVDIQAREIITLHERVHELEESNQQVALLIEKLNQLQTENASLRDQNDELTVEIESTNRRQLLGNKRRGNSSPYQPKEDGDSPRLGKVRRYSTQNDLSLETSQMQELAIQPVCIGGSLQVECDDSVIFNSSCEVDSVENNKSSSDDEGSAASTNKSLRMSAIVEENEMLRSQLKEMRATLEDCRLKLSREYSIQNIPLEGPDINSSCKVVSNIWAENKYLKNQLEEIKSTLTECQTKLAKVLPSITKDEETETENLGEINPEVKAKLLEIQAVLESLPDADFALPTADTSRNIKKKAPSDEKNKTSEDPGSDGSQNAFLQINLNEVQSRITKIIEANKICNFENSVLKSQISNLLTQISKKKENKEEIPWNINDLSMKNSSHTENISCSTLSNNFTDLSNYAFDLPSKHLQENQFCSLDSYKLNKNNLNVVSNRSDPDAFRMSSISNNLISSIPKEKTIYVNNLEAELLSKNYKNVEVPNSGINESVQLFMNKIFCDSDGKCDSFPSLKSESEETSAVNLDKLRESFQSPLKIWKLATLEAFLEERDSLLLKCSKVETLSQENNELNDAIKQYKNELSEKEDSIKKLTEKCETLEKGIELLKDEYEECENYWNDKLDEERRLFDEEQKISNEKYADLEKKIQEYASLFSNPVDETTTLPTIEERGDLEKQFIDLEEEFELFRKKASLELEDKETEMNLLKELLNQQQAEKCSVEVQTHSNADFVSTCTSCSLEKADVPEIKISFPQEELQSAIEKLKAERKRLDADCRNLKFRKSDLLRQLSNFRRTNVTYSNPYGLHILNSVTTKLYQTEMKCRHLQSALKHQKRLVEKLLSGSWEDHHSDLLQARKTLKSTQDKLAEQVELSYQQMEKLRKADTIAKDLYIENAKLMEMLRYKQFCSCTHGSLTHSL
nr:PREDICTED: blastoderm-specific protein 25D [Bemisia tabaci]